MEPRESNTVHTCHAGCQCQTGGQAPDDFEPPPYMGDEPLGTCVVHGDYWTDDCLRCRGER